MLDEAVEVMRLLWQGENQTHPGKHYTVEDLRIFDLPDDPVEIMVAAMQPEAAELAGRVGDGLINVAPKKEIIALVEGSASQELPLPSDCEQLVENRSADLYIHQIGPDQEGS